MEDLLETDIAAIVDRFYERVRADVQLGPAFAIVGDWDTHLRTLCDFWSSLMLTSGRYKGNPLAAHIAHADKIQPEMFSRWLELWRETTCELVAPAIAAEMQAKAERIAFRFSQNMYGAEPTASIGAERNLTVAGHRVPSTLS
jgi:hemoglobin